MSAEVVRDEQELRREMHDLTALFFGFIRNQTDASEKAFRIREINEKVAKADQSIILPTVHDIEGLLSVPAVRGAFWKLSLPEDVVELGTVKTLVEGDAGTIAQYIPDHVLSVTTLVASISSTRPSTLSFLETPDEVGRRRMMQVTADGPVALGKMAAHIFPQTMINPKYSQD